MSDLSLALGGLMIAYHTKRIPERYWGESDEDRRARLQLIAEADERVCDEAPVVGWPKAACMAMLATVQEWESGLERAVHSGDKRGPAGERCLVQIHERATRDVAVYVDRFAITRDEWERLGGLSAEATFDCARAGWKVLSKHIVRCHVRFEGASWSMAARVFAEFHHPASDCRALWSPTISDRGGTYAKIYRELRKAEAAGQVAAQ